mgnify:CR=1 FL=1
MKNKIWLGMAFLLMMIAIPMVMLLTVTVNSSLSTAQFLWFATPVLTVCSSLLAFWYLKQDDRTARQSLQKNR